MNENVLKHAIKAAHDNADAQYNRAYNRLDFDGMNYWRGYLNAVEHIQGIIEDLEQETKSNVQTSSKA